MNGKRESDLLESWDKAKDYPVITNRRPGGGRVHFFPIYVEGSENQSTSPVGMPRRDSNVVCRSELHKSWRFAARVADRHFLNVCNERGDEGKARGFQSR